MPESAPHILVAGLGNELLSDDGVGVHACRLVRQQTGKLGSTQVVVAEIGTAVCDALHLLEWAEFILAIDAMHGGSLPGTIYWAKAGDLEQEGRVGLHQLSLLGALQMVEQEVLGRAAGYAGASSRTPHWQRPRVAYLGVEPASLELGLTLSPPVRHALPRIAEQALQQIEAWRAGGPRP